MEGADWGEEEQGRYLRIVEFGIGWDNCNQCNSSLCLALRCRRALAGASAQTLLLLTTHHISPPQAHTSRPRPRPPPASQSPR